MITQLRSKLACHLVPIVTVGGIRFYCPTPFCHWRARTLLTNEPETLQWIDSMKPGDVFYDIGANVGCYAMYAARRGLTVVAIEPGAATYAVLQKNIELNASSVLAYNVALGRETGMGNLYQEHTEAGRALHSIRAGSGFPQSTLVFSLDKLIYQFDLPFPNHIKIDVDGIEADVLAGATDALHYVKTLMVENLEDVPPGFKLTRVINESSASFNAFYERFSQSERTNSIR